MIVFNDNLDLLSNLATRYTPCSEPAKRKCASPRITGMNGINEKTCKHMCDINKRCNFAFWNMGHFCAWYETCDELNSAKGTGTIFAKPGKTCPRNEVGVISK